MNIPFSPPDVGEDEITAIIDALRSGWITTGPKTKEFERRIASYCGTKKAVCLNSATACLEMALRVLGIGPGDEVITSAYTYTATASSILHTGARVVLVDTQKDSFEMDYQAMGESITEKTKAIIPVDIAGILCDYEQIFQVVEDKKSLFKPQNKIQENLGRIAVVADSAHGFGAEEKGKKSGSFADFTAFSFHAVKNLTTAEGGAVVWNDIDDVDNEGIYQEFMLLSLHGQSKDALAKTKLGAWEYDIIIPAYKCNMTDIAAGMGLAQLDTYQEKLDKRRRIVECYNSGLADENVAVLPHYSFDKISSGHLYMVRLLGGDEAYRNQIIEKMAENGIATNVHYKPLPLFTAYKNLGFSIENYPHAFGLYENEITLPLHTRLSDEEVAYIISTLKRILGEDK